MQQTLIFDPELIRRYDRSGPRYTSYPTAVQFHQGFSEQRYRDIATATNAAGGPLSLYFHIPFCDTICYYCACNKVVTKRREKAEPYLHHLYRELQMQGALFDRERVVDQLHWGGGTPTFISHQQMRELMAETRRHFTLHDDDQGEYSIEIDPREADAETIKVLRELGFNRMSLGVQDFNPAVQKAVNRIQSEEQTVAVLDAARAQGFKSVSLDLIYGLPFQTQQSFIATVDRVIDFGPDRLSVFNYAHLPEMFKPQRRIDAEQLPSAAEKLAILETATTRLLEAGYVYIGMDHFARPDDELAIAQREGSLYRNFQGYSTHADCDLIGLGATSIGQVGNSYSQNLKSLDDYYATIDAGHLPVFRGVELTDDDLLRRRVITDLICNFQLEFASMERQHTLVFEDYFAAELAELSGMADDGLLRISERRIEVLPPGRLLIRNICMVFDSYLRASREQRFSKVI